MSQVYMTQKQMQSNHSNHLVPINMFYWERNPKLYYCNDSSMVLEPFIYISY